MRYHKADLKILDHLWKGPMQLILMPVGLRTKRTPGKTFFECTIHVKCLNFLLQLIPLCQKMSRFYYHEVSQGRLENIGPPLEEADATNSQARTLRAKRTLGKTFLECKMQDKFLNFLLKLIHLCQKMSTFSYREASRGRLENI